MSDNVEAPRDIVTINPDNDTSRSVKDYGVIQGGFMSIIEKAAAIENMDVDKLERMMKMQLEWESRQEERQFNDSMAKISEQLAKVRIVRKNSVSYKAGETAFKYAKIEEIDQITRGMIDAEKITISYDTEPCTIQGWHTIVARASKGLCKKESRIPLPLDTSGGKNSSQGMGSTHSYGRRYALCALFNIVTVGEDDDASGSPITDDQAKEIKDGLKKSGLDVQKFLSTLKAITVEEIKSKDYGRAMTAIDAKLYRLSQDKKLDSEKK